MPAKEAVLTGAVDLARAAAVEAAERAEDVGEHLGCVAEGERLVSHRFASHMAGYPGWQWVVTLARAHRARYATVCEVELLPGDGALLAPAWVPWADRLLPGDIGPGDVLPFQPDDPRLQPGYLPVLGERDPAPGIDELALARMRVLNETGRESAAQRWYRSSHGPTSAGALKASAACSTCAFALPLAGSMGQMFAVCSNEWSPDDGQVVSLDHGCGAHSETDVDAQSTAWPDPAPFIDEHNIELLDLADDFEAAAKSDHRASRPKHRRPSRQAVANHELAADQSAHLGSDPAYPSEDAGD